MTPWTTRTDRTSTEPRTDRPTLDPLYALGGVTMEIRLPDEARDNRRLAARELVLDDEDQERVETWGIDRPLGSHYDYHGTQILVGCRVELTINGLTQYGAVRGSQGTVTGLDPEGAVDIDFDNGHQLAVMPSWVAIFREEEEEEEGIDTGGTEMPEILRTPNGVEIVVGQRVQAITNDLRSSNIYIGAQGTVSEISRDVQVNFDTYLHGNLWARPDWIEAITGGVTPDDSIMFERLLGQTNDLMIVGTQLFQLRAEEITSGSEILRRYQQQLIQQFNQARENLRRKEQALEIREAERCNMPTVSLYDVTRGMRVYKDSRSVCFIMPFHYAPNRIQYNGVTKKLTDEHQAEAIQDCLLQVDTSNGSEARLMLLKSEDYQNMEHYHSQRGYNCTGDMQLPRGIPSSDELWALRDRYQEVLTVINRDSPGTSHPEGMSHIDILWSEATAISSDEHWTTIPERRAYQVGDLVQVLRSYDSFPQDDVGSIGRVVTVNYETSIGVEFLFDFSGHNCSGTCPDGYGYNFNIDYIRHAPIGARRTRERGIYRRMSNEERTDLR